MEYTTRVRSAAAVDDVGNGRRFPDPPPSHVRDTDSASADMAALVFRREQLLQELHRERIRHDMILCELAETERVMTACLAGQGAWCGRPLLTPWEEAMYRTARSSEETSWWCRSPSSPAIAPVYPCVERSPSPVLQPRPVDNAEKQERGSSFRPLAVEQCLSLSKQLAVEEALVPAATNVVAKPAQPVLLSKEVQLECRGVVDHVHKAGLMDCEVQRSEQPVESEIHRSEEPKREAFGQEHEAEEKDRHAVQLPMIIEDHPAEPTIKDRTDDEQRLLPHQYALAGKDQSSHNDQKRQVFNEPNTQIMPSEVKGRQIFGPTVETPPPKRHKPHEEWSCTHCQVSLSCEEDLTQHKAGELHRLVVALSQPRQEPLELTTKSTPESSYRSPQFLRRMARPVLPVPDNLEKSEPQKAKRASPFDMCNHPKHTSHQENTHASHTKEGGKEGSKWAAHRTGTEDQRKKFMAKRRPLFCEICKVQCNSEKMMESHLRGKKHEESTRALHAEEGGKEGIKCAADRTGPEDRRRFATKTRLRFCELCNVQCGSEKTLESHLGGKKHLEKLQAHHQDMQSRLVSVSGQVPCSM